MSHIPVMLNEVLDHLIIEDGGTYIDATFGAGGYSKAILEKYTKTKVIAIDCDPEVIKIAEDLKNRFGERFNFISGKFSTVLGELRATQAQGVVFDLGVSSMQLDEGHRGFSFQKEGPLDMRMSREGHNASWFVNNMSEKEIADVLFHYGDEKRSRSIARHIISARQNKHIDTTKQLAEIIYDAIGHKKAQDKIDPATRSFQAIRIWVNDEVNELKLGLERALMSLKLLGRLAIVTFHSIEDLIVKKFCKDLSQLPSNNSRYHPSVEHNDWEPSLKIINKKPILPSIGEIKLNPRARSAKLRVVEKIGTICKNHI